MRLRLVLEEHFFMWSSVYRKSQSTETLVESLKDPPPMGTHTLPHPIWYSDTLMWKLIVKKEKAMCNVYNSWFFIFVCFRSEEELHNVKVTHKPPESFVDKVSYLPNESARKWAGGLGYKSDMTCRSCVKNFGTQGTGFHEQQTFATSWFIYTSNSTSLGYHILKKK